MPLIVGHRGAGADHVASGWPENSLASIEAGFELGADLVEVDVQLDARGKVVLWHDAVISFSGDRFIPVRELTQQQLSYLAGHGRTGNFPPSLDDALAVALAHHHRRLVMDIELKVYATCDRVELLAGVLRVVDRHRAADRVMITSSDIPILRQLKQQRPEIEAGLIAPVPLLDWNFFVAELDAGVPVEWFLARRNLRAWAMYPERLAAEARRRGIKVGVWTVNDPSQIQAFVAAGYDMIITDDPATARRLIARGHGAGTSDPMGETLREARLVPHVLLPF